MILPRECKIEKAVEKPCGRPALEEPYLRTNGNGEAKLVATNRFILAIVPVEVTEEDTDGHIPLEAIKAARKVGGIGANLLLSPDRVDVPGVASYPRQGRNHGGFPDETQLVPAERTEFTFKLNAKLLYDLAQALGATDSVLQLWFTPNEDGEPDCHRAIHVEGGRGSGLIMPVRVK